MKLIIFFPIYNEELGLEAFLLSLPKKLNGVDEIEFLAVNDGSSDSSQVILDKFNIKTIFHNENLGLGIAFQSAIKYALENEVDFLVSIDADNQFDPQEIQKMIKAFPQGYDFILGDRFLNGRPKNMPYIKFLGNKLMAKIISFISGKKLQDVACGFRAYSREALLNLNIFGKFTYTQEVILDLLIKNKQFIEIPISVKYFRDRKSAISSNLFNYAWRTMKIIFNSLISYRPLFLFGGIGIILFILGLIPDLFVFSYYLKTQLISPYKMYAFIGGFLNICGFLFLIIGLTLQALKRIRLNQEKILYNQKKRYLRK